MKFDDLNELMAKIREQARGSGRPEPLSENLSNRSSAYQWDAMKDPPTIEQLANTADVMRKVREARAKLDGPLEEACRLVIAKGYDPKTECRVEHVQEAIIRAGADIEFPLGLPDGVTRSMGPLPKRMKLGEIHVYKRSLYRARHAWFDQHGVRGRRCDRRRWILRARTIFPIAHDAVLQGKKAAAILVLMEVFTATDAAWIIETGQTWGESRAGRDVMLDRADVAFFSRELKMDREDVVSAKGLRSMRYIGSAPAGGIAEVEIIL